MPIEVQRKRSRGFRLPENTVCVNRPLKYGNPFKVINNDICGYNSDIGEWIFIESRKKFPDAISARKRAVQLFEEYVNGNCYPLPFAPYNIADIKNDLKGKNLACFCPVGSECHRTVLLKIANEE